MTGPIERTQATQLAAIFAQHTLRDSGSGYDWPAIIGEVSTVLSGPQLEAFRTACVFRKTSDQMYAIAVKQPGRTAIRRE